MLLANPVTRVFVVHRVESRTTPACSLTAGLPVQLSPRPLVAHPDPAPAAAAMLAHQAPLALY